MCSQGKLIKFVVFPRYVLGQKALQPGDWKANQMLSIVCVLCLNNYLKKFKLSLKITLASSFLIVGGVWACSNLRQGEENMNLLLSYSGVVAANVTSGVSFTFVGNVCEEKQT